MYETSKATRRRARDPRFMDQWFRGNAIDIGCGPDPLSPILWPFLQDVETWDLEDGDAQLMEGVPSNAYDLTYSSHCLEHMRDPIEALHHWWRITKPGGHLVVVVPDEDLYEQGVWPPQWNTDHKATFTVMKRASWSPVSHNLAELLADLPGADILKLERLTEHYLTPAQLTARGIPQGQPVDQTSQWIAECAIECVVRKAL